MTARAGVFALAPGHCFGGVAFPIPPTLRVPACFAVSPLASLC